MDERALLEGMRVCDSDSGRAVRTKLLVAARWVAHAMAPGAARDESAAFATLVETLGALRKLVKHDRANQRAQRPIRSSRVHKWSFAVAHAVVVEGHTWDAAVRFARDRERARAHARKWTQEDIAIRQRLDEVAPNISAAVQQLSKRARALGALAEG